MPEFSDKIEAYSQRRIDALKRGRDQWGHGGRHRGNGAPDCPRTLHHHHDEFCMLPLPSECALAGVTAPEGGWRSRA